MRLSRTVVRLAEPSKAAAAVGMKVDYYGFANLA